VALGRPGSTITNNRIETRGYDLEQCSVGAYYTVNATCTMIDGNAMLNTLIARCDTEIKKNTMRDSSCDYCLHNSTSRFLTTQGGD
jgi:hypothetical protein